LRTRNCQASFFELSEGIIYRGLEAEQLDLRDGTFFNERFGDFEFFLREFCVSVKFPFGSLKFRQALLVLGTLFGQDTDRGIQFPLP